jgi:hypothetical protein
VCRFDGGETWSNCSKFATQATTTGQCTIQDEGAATVPLSESFNSTLVTVRVAAVNVLNIYVVSADWSSDVNSIGE